MRTKFTSTLPNGTRVTHYTHEGSGGPTSTTYQDHEKHLFAFPALLEGSKLLKIAETRSNQQISDAVTAARVANSNPGLTGAAVASRIRAALNDRAAETGTTLQEAQAAFAAVRKANGLRVHESGLKRASRKKPNTTVEETPEKKDASDSELSEFETDTEQ